MHKDPHRFKVIVAHRRFGKTTFAINELIRHAAENPGNYWYIAPTYRQAKMIALDLFRHYTPRTLIEKVNEQELTLRLVSGSLISLKGAENKDSLRGVGLKGIVLDEYGLMEKDVWEAIIRPMLNDHKGWAIFIGTPNGRNHFYNLFIKEHPDWSSYRFPYTASHVLDPDEVESSRLELSEDVFRQEYLAEFLEGSGTVFRKIKEVLRPPNECYEEPRMDRAYQLGVDLARLRDFTVLTVVDNNFKVVYFERISKLDWDSQKLKILYTSERYNKARIVIDATGVGDPIAQELLRVYGVPVLPYKISSSDAKKVLIENLKLRIEQRQITIPDEPTLVKELESYNYQISDTGRVKYGAPSGEHDDCVVSLALAVWDIVPQSAFSIGDRLAILDDEY